MCPGKNPLLEKKEEIGILVDMEGVCHNLNLLDPCYRTICELDAIDILI